MFNVAHIYVCMYICMTIHLALNNPSHPWKRLNLSLPRNCLLLLPVPWAASSQKPKVTVYCWRHLPRFSVLTLQFLRKGEGEAESGDFHSPFQDSGSWKPGLSFKWEIKGSPGVGLPSKCETISFSEQRQKPALAGSFARLPLLPVWKRWLSTCTVPREIRGKETFPVCFLRNHRHL